MSAERVTLAVIATVFEILIAFVRSDHDGDARMIAGAHALEDVDRAHDVGGNGFLRLLVRAADERLRGEMENDTRARDCEGGADGLRVADVGNHVVEALGQTELAEKRWISVRLARETMDFGTKQKQPLA